VKRQGGPLRQPDHQGCCRRPAPADPAEHRHARQPQTCPEGRGATGQLKAAERPARLHHQRLTSPARPSECTYQGKAVLLPDRHQTPSASSTTRPCSRRSTCPPPAHMGAGCRPDAKGAHLRPHPTASPSTRPADEQSTWQLEPFFWSQGGNLNKVETRPRVQQIPLQLWVQHGQGTGPRSKSVLQWGPGPRTSPSSFLHKTAAMIEGPAPWNLPRAERGGLEVQQAVRHRQDPRPRPPAVTVVAPAGAGETWNIGNSGSSEQQKRGPGSGSRGAQEPSVMTHITSLMYYLPTKPAVISQLPSRAARSTRFFAKETATARSRTDPVTAPTTRRCRRRCGQRSSPRLPARHRSVPR